MPKIYLPKRTIVLTNDTNEILIIFNHAIQKFKDDPKCFASFSHSDPKPRDNTIFSSILIRIEALTGQRRGAEELEFLDHTHTLSADAYLLYQQYKNFLIKLIYLHKGDASFELVSARKVSNRTVLVHELLLRMAAEALNEDQEEKAGYEILAIIANFYEQLKKSDVFIDKDFLSKKYLSSYADDLFRTYNKWQDIFRSRIDCIQRINKNKNIINKAIEQLIMIKKGLLSLLIAEAVKQSDRDLTSERSLDDDFIEVITFNEYMVNLSKVLKVNEGVSLPQQGLFSMIELTDYYQNIITKLGSRGLIIKKLFLLLVESNKLARIAEKINSIIVGTGWFPFMAGIVNTTEFNAKYSEHITRCIDVINSYIADTSKSKFNNLNLAMVRASSLDISTILLEQFETVNGLEELNNPQLLKELSEHFKSEINELLILQQISNCVVINRNRLQQLVTCVSVVDLADSSALTTIEHVKSLFTSAVTSFEQNKHLGLDEFNRITRDTEPLIKYFELSQFHKGFIFLQSKQYQSALECFNSIKWMNDDKLFFNRGVCYLGLDKKSEALSEFNQIDIKSPLSKNALQHLQMLTPPAAKSPSLTEISRNWSSSMPQSRQFEKLYKPVASTNSLDDILIKFQNFRYTQPLDPRIDKRELKVIQPPKNVSEIKSILKTDKRSKSKFVYIYFNESKQTWHYFYSKNEGKKSVIGELSICFVPAMALSPDVELFNKTKKYLLTIILDEKYKRSFQNELRAVAQDTLNDVVISDSECSDSGLSKGFS